MYSLRLPLATALLLTACFCALLREAGAGLAWSISSAIGLVGFVGLQWSGITRVYRGFFFLACGLGVGLWGSERLTVPELAEAIDRAAFFSLFLTSLAVLRESASTSRLVRQCGEVLVDQPPGRRYLLMSFGAQLFGVMLNVGSLNVLGNMVQRGVKPGRTEEQQRIAGIRLKRMLTATLRGFSSALIWTPTSVTMLLVLSGIPELTWEEYAPMGLVWSTLFILLGAVLDRFSYPRRNLGYGKGGSLTRLIPLVALVALFPIIAFVVSRGTGFDLFAALLICAPFIGTTWIGLQYRRAGFWTACRLLGRRIVRSFPSTFTGQRNEVTLFASSGFIGVVLIPLIDPEHVSQWLKMLHIGEAGLMVLVSLLILVFSFVGISAIVTVTVLLGVIQNMPEIAIPAMVQASVIAITWALFAGASPFTASLRFISRYAGTSPLRFGIIWNGAFTVLVLSVMYAALFFYLGTG